MQKSIHIHAGLLLFYAPLIRSKFPPRSVLIVSVFVRVLCCAAQILVVALILFKGHTFIESNKCYQLSKHGDAVDPLPCVGDDTYSPYYNKDYPYLVQYPPGGGIVSGRPASVCLSVCE